MKLKDGFVLRQVAETWVVLPLGPTTIDFNGMLTLNESGAMLWKVLEQGGNKEDMTNMLTSEYDVSYEDALTDVNAFIDKLIQIGCI